MLAKKFFFLTSFVAIFFALEAQAKEDLNDCSIGVCNYDQIQSPDLGKFEELKNQIHLISDKAMPDPSIPKDLINFEIKKANECKKLTSKQVDHMFFQGQQKSAREDAFETDMIYNVEYKKQQAVNKDFIILEVFMHVNGRYGKGNIPYTLIQKRGSCQLLKYIKGYPFKIN